MKKKIVYQLLSVFLCVLMVAQCLPMRAIAQGVQSLAATSESEAETPASEKALALEESKEEEPYILYELVEKREKDTKHFLMSDRSVMAAKYEVPVHYKKNGEWVDINLTAVDSVSEISMPENDFETKFSKKSNGKKLVTVTKDDHKLSWGLEGATKVEAEYSSFDSSAFEDISVLKNLEGIVTYPEIFSNVDLEYVVSGEGIKENIILKNENAPTEFRFHYETGHLSLRLNDEGNLELIDGEKVIFTIEKPVMFDSAKAFSDKVEMILEETDNGKFTLTLIPDKDWLFSEERTWPVVIDPTTFSSLVQSNIWDIDMSNRYPNEAMNYLATDNVVGSNGSSEAWRALIWVKNLPDIGSSTVVNAQMRISNYPGPTNEKWNESAIRPRPSVPIQVNAHRITEYWPETTATWNGYAHKYNPTIEDYFIYYGNETFFHLDLTELVFSWYQNPTTNYGVLIKSNDETAYGQIMQFTSSDFSVESSTNREYRPKLFITYRDTVGLEDYWSYTTQSHSEGTGYINNHNGNLTWVLPDLSFNSGINGFTLSHVYNSASSVNDHYGNGWNLSLAHKFLPFTAENGGNATYVYTDGDGTNHYFVPLEDGSIVDEDGLGYTFTSISESELIYQITTKDKTVLKFDQWGDLRKIIDPNGNTIDLHYSWNPGNNFFKVITTSSGGWIELFYDSNGNLSSAMDNADRHTTHQYDDTEPILKKVTKPDGSEINFEYTEGKLSKVVFSDGLSYCYTYDSCGRVATVCQGGNTEGSTRGLKTFSYSYNQTAITEESGYQLTYQFDTWGRPTCIYDNYDQSYFQTYTNQSNTSENLFANNKVTLTASSVQYIDNRLVNPAFTTGLNGWISPENGGAVNDQKYLSSYSAKMVGETEGIHVIQQTPRYESEGTYTYSAYLKWENVTTSLGYGAGLEIVTSYDGKTQWYLSELVTGSSDPSVENGFVRFEKIITLRPGETIQRVTAGIYHGTGTVWVNGIQFEEGESANHVNLLSNSGFEANANGTATPSYFDNNAPYGSVSTAEKKSGAFSYRIQGQGNLNQYVAQPTGLSGKAGDVYTFGAWAKADALPSHETDGTAGLKMVMQIVLADGSGNLWANVLFNENVSDWQFGTQTVVIEKDYRDIYLYLCYYKNANTAYFDSAFLYRDTAQSYRYDGNGNVVSTTDYASQQNSYSYQNNNLSKLISPDGTGFEYFYDAKGNLVSSHSAEGLVNQFTYDEKGNPISSETFANESSATIVSGKTYYIQMKSTGQYLTLKNASTAVGTGVVEVPFTGGGEQRWKFVSSPQGGFVIIPENAPGLALDVAGGADTENANIQIYTQNGTPAQRFFVNPQRNYTYQLTPASSSTGKVVTLNRPLTPDQVTILTPQGEMNPDQCWIIKEAVSAPALEEGLYHIRVRHSGAYVDVPGYSSAVGTALQQHEYNDSKAQIFCIKPYGNTEYFTLSPVYAPEQYVQVSSSTNSDGLKKVELGDGTITDADLFSFQYNSATRDWSIVCKDDSAVCLCISRGDTANGAGLIAQLNIKEINQRFILEKVSPRITSSMTYQDNGNFPHTVTDSRGNTTTYEYDFEKGLLTATTDAKGSVTGYTHDPNNDLVKSVTSGSSTVRYLYQNGGYLQSITSPSDTAYSFIYDEFYQNTEIWVGEQALSTNIYDEEGKITKTTYGNRDYIEFVYDNLDQIVEKKYNGVAKVRYRYDKSGRLYEAQDLFENTTTRYRYDLSGRVLEAKRSDGKILRYTYDDLNRVSKITTTLNGTTSSTEYLYGDTAAGQKAGLIYGVKENGTQTLSYAYDELVRLKERTLDATANDFTTEYGYLEGQGNNTTTLIKTVKNGNDTLTYTYDELGNITSVKKNGALIESYTYDSLNQLHSVTRGNDTWEYTYDNGGNILSVKKNGTVEKSYTYGNANWKDLLTAFNGQSITYDAIGNPLQYRDGMAFTWVNGRRLNSVSYNGNSISYAYNEAGLRISKTVNGVTTNYHWLEGVLLGQTSGSDTILFLYDESGSAYGFTLNGTAYYYVFNLQGDVIGILNSNGTQVVSYDYDAWGNILSVTGSLASTLGNLNPLRYRGYYYDVETGFYATGTRYYDPEIGRFISPDTTDVLTATPMGLTDKNLFAYCDNNPVVRVDRGGQFWESAFDVISLGASIVEVCVNPTDIWAWAGLVGDAVDLIPFVTGVGEVTRAVKTTVKVADKATDVLDTANTLYKTADAASDIRKATGSYEIVYKSGKNYIGKGNFNRAITSAKIHAEGADDILSIRWKSAPSSRDAFIDEYLMQKRFGGVLRSNPQLSTHNIIWSPGRKYYGR